MKITKYPQSCLLIETKNKRILVDPGMLKYKDEYFDVWNGADAILITHKHQDHCNISILEKINKDITIYSTKEVQDAYPTLNVTIIADKDFVTIGKINIEVVKAIHGYQPMLKGNKEIHENVGYIIDDGEHRVYVTSDTICFNNEYKADVICMPATGYGITMSAFEAALYAKEVEAKTIILVHMDSPLYITDLNYIDEMFKKQELKYIILENEENIIVPNVDEPIMATK
jgi:L-ascorbate metabolism protein UlaG (beta-lactamase superfamily)